MALYELGKSGHLVFTHSRFHLSSSLNLESDFAEGFLISKPPQVTEVQFCQFFCL